LIWERVANSVQKNQNAKIALQSIDRRRRSVIAAGVKIAQFPVVRFIIPKRRKIAGFLASEKRDCSALKDQS
jgi:hypothetical protein